jgi:transcriptional pleiotropic regulator of transition state genes
VETNYNIFNALAYISGREAMIVKATGIVRKVDELGRIVLPIELRRTLDIEERDSLEIYLDGEKIVLQKYEQACLFCGATRGLSVYRGKNICHECIRNLNKA